ncbi:hypothetical protein QFC21_001116 [Naganishia friedmannii]|uniref:Uncharacterized protein n=1 Tax=Naganishia friedmannii TaxID=89922 RepID=A0ACC2W9C6_9TREE|nr:hypothetical protein QFC21_001116 [Naganishia friedmannii]
MRFITLASLLAAFSSCTLAQTQLQAAANRAATASPTGSVGCYFLNDEWNCAAPRTNGIVAAGASAIASATYSVPSPTESTGCTWHISHWDCTGNVDGSAAQDSSSGSCIVHVGHTHGDCSGIDTSCGVASLGTYNQGLHIGAIFIVLVTSGIGVMIPLFSGRRRSGTAATAAKLAESKPLFSQNSFWSSLLFIAKHFGTGIIISTAFIHLLFHGFVMFNNECVGELAFEATAPAIALAAFFVTFLLAFFGARYFHSEEGTETPRSLEKSSTPESPDLLATNMRALEEHGHSHSHGFEIVGKDQHWQVMILEVGIIFHSIMIGVTLGAGTRAHRSLLARYEHADDPCLMFSGGGEGWSTLLIVIVFHQFFEGLALGARIALLDYSRRWTPWVMGLAFTLITPIGIAIGVGVHENFSANGKAPLLAVGILNSISAGILLYTAAELLSTDFTAGSLLRAKMTRVLTALAALVAGMICMSVLGKWA